MADVVQARRGAGRGYRIEKPMAPGSETVANSDQAAMGGVKNKPSGMPSRGRGSRIIGAQKDDTKSGGGVDSKAGGDRRVNSSSPSGSSPDRNIEKELKKMELTELAKRPSFGSIGRRIHLLANHFEVKLSGGKTITLTQYHIEISHPRLKLTRDENRVCFWKVVGDNPVIFPTPFTVAYDGSRQCFSLNRFKFPNDNATYKFEFEIQLNREDKPSPVAVLFQNVGPVVLDLRVI